MTDLQEQYQYDMYTQQLKAEKDFYLAWCCGLTYGVFLLFLITVGAVVSAHMTKEDPLCRHVAAEYQYLVQHQADVAGGE